jgi:hypothetical protein
MNPPAPNLHPGCLALGLLGLLAACQPPNLDLADYPRSEPKLADVAGVYVLTADSLKEVRERGHYPAAATSITLASDGSLTCRNIPDWWLATPPGKFSGGFVNATGKWQVAKQQQWWAVEVQVKKDSDPEVERTSFNLVGAKPPFALRLVLGDPDEGHGMDFTKATTQNPPTPKP